MSLADELLADFDDLTRDLNVPLEKNPKSERTSVPDKIESHCKRSVFHVARLIKSDKAKRVLERIEFSTEKKKTQNSQLCDSNANYDVVVDANSLLAEIDTEITTVYKYLKDIYNKRFPELESLVTSAYEYIHTVNYLGNVTDSVKLDGIDFLPPAIKMVVTVTASSTLGEILSDQEMDLVKEACQLGFDLADAK
ncbi:hypothetical protein MXB_4517, partial [Myxobolus squamalis]